MNRTTTITKPNLKKRLFAGLIDYSIIFIFTYLIFDIWGETNAEGKIHVIGFPALSIFIFWFIWTIGFEQFFGATYGNSLFKLKPISIRKNHLKLTLGQSIKRHLVDLIDLSPIGLGLLKNTENNQRLGDIWAETVVIDVTDQNQSVKKFDEIPFSESYNLPKRNIATYFFKRVAAFLIDILLFALIMKVLTPYIGHKFEGKYYTSTLTFITCFYCYFLSQDLIFKQTLGKRIFNLKLKLLESESLIIKNDYVRIIFRRIFDLLAFVFPFIDIASIFITNKNQKIGDRLTRIIVDENNKNYR